MSQHEPFRIFVTHGWDESDDYLRVFEYLESARGFLYRNCAMPGVVSSSASSEIQRESLRGQIAKAEVVIALATQFATKSDLLVFEMTFAQASKKPVLLLRPFGASATLPRTLTDLANVVLDWDERALVDAIRELARGERSGRWDVIEFKPD
jgi:hypothetical protein